jgi:phospholipid/cholesterol/gamma-HCH transport system substrate-binding protein
MKEIIIGALFIASLAIVLYLAFALGGTGSLGEAFGPKQRDVKVRFPEVTGLKVRNDVLVSGVRVGSVTGLAPQRDGTVIVTARLDESAPLYANARAEMINISPLGGKAVAINPGTVATGPLNTNEDEIPGTYVQDFFNAAGKLMDKMDTGLEVLVDTLRDVNTIVRDVRDGKGTVGTLLRDEDTARHVQEMVTELRDASRGINTVSRELTTLMDEVNHGHGLVHRAFYDEKMATQVSEAVTNVRNGTAEFERLMIEARAIAAKADGGDGMVSALLNDPKLKADLKSAMAEASSAIKNVGEAAGSANAMISNINKGKGTLGKLATDDALYNDLLRAVNTLQQGFEDVREQAPVTTFASVVFQVFQ